MKCGIAMFPTDYSITPSDLGQAVEERGFDSLWFPDHVQYEHHKVAEGWSLLVFALARYPDKLCGFLMAL